jgi:hypothetical protein
MSIGILILLLVMTVAPLAAVTRYKESLHPLVVLLLKGIAGAGAFLLVVRISYLVMGWMFQLVSDENAWILILRTFCMAMVIACLFVAISGHRRKNPGARLTGVLFCALFGSAALWAFQLAPSPLA